ncbi:inorganic phosphate transporter [Conexibacter sp. SYSU D00693]|uniref:inorganic phosphate transporter n=1 Tax=Conexibacter sp. SYSU D00693 TaxID=2812560 RepID=UPI00196B6085|nr:inorganic phosphate transporter [Conexibacter sp. SYSU D00693]
MDAADVVLALVVLTALAFDFTNGFHDTANAMATSIATRALSARKAVALAAVLNFVGAFLSLEVAATIAEDIVDPAAITPAIILAGLLGGILWNLLTWRLGLPSSSSHALIGGVVGAVVVAAGFDAVEADGLVGEVLVPSVIAPVLALVVAGLATFVVFRRIRDWLPDRIQSSFRHGQLASASLVALSHGTNDAQKTMGVITLALVAHGSLDRGAGVPAWVVVCAAAAISLGTAIGGWRIIRTVGHRLTEINAAQGFSAETSGAMVILAASHAGFPLSTTHVTSGAVLGAGVGRRAAEVRWGVAGQMVVAWLLTLPAAALIAAVAYLGVDELGGEVVGPLVVSAAAAVAAVGLFLQAQRNAPITAKDV